MNRELRFSSLSIKLLRQLLLLQLFDALDLLYLDRERVIVEVDSFELIWLHGRLLIRLGKNCVFAQ